MKELADSDQRPRGAFERAHILRVRVGLAMSGRMRYARYYWLLNERRVRIT